MKISSSRRRKPLCRKYRHRTREAAEIAARRTELRWNRRGRREQVMYPEYCALCRAFHVTSKPFTPTRNRHASEAAARRQQMKVYGQGKQAKDAAVAVQQ